MKKTLLLLLTLVGALSSKAGTIDRIMSYGGDAVATYRAYQTLYLKACAMSWSEGITFEKVSDTELKIKGLWKDELSFNFKLYNTSGRLDAEGTRLIHTYTENDESGKWRLCGFTGSAYYKTPRDLTLTILESANGISIGTETSTFFTYAYAGDNYNINHEDRQFDGVNIRLFKANAVATDMLHSIDWGVSGNSIWIKEKDTRERQYNMFVDIVGNDIYMTNLANNGLGINDQGYVQGWSFSNYVHEIHATIENDGRVKLDNSQPARPMYRNGPDVYGYVDSTSTYQIWELYPSIFVSTDILEDGSIDSNFSNDIYGTYSPEEVSHNGVSHGWVTNDGLRRTYEDFKLTFDNFNYYANYLFQNEINMDEIYSGTSIHGNNDVTVDVKLHLNNLSVVNGKIGVHGEIETVANPQYVDHYEICITPGLYSSINDEGFEHHAELGHVNATNLHEVTPENTWYIVPRAGAASMAAAADAETATLRTNDYRFFKYPENLDVTHPNDKYTVFIKTVYKPETGLTPTFHDMQYVQTPTGIDESLIDSAEAATEYYTLQGVRVVEPQRGNIYIVRRGNEVNKIIF